MAKSTYENRIAKIIVDFSYGDISEETAKLRIAYELYTHLGVSRTLAQEIVEKLFQ